MLKKRKLCEIGPTPSSPSKRLKTFPLRVVRVGIDGGGTSTKCVFLPLNSLTPVSIYSSGCTNVNSVGAIQSVENLKRCLVGAIGLLPSEYCNFRIKSVGLAMSSVDRKDDMEMTLRWINDIIEKNVSVKNRCKDMKVCVNNDAAGALCSGTLGELEGIVVISGTGCICYGYLNKDTSFRSGGWGPLFLDKGSGYWIGQQILTTITASIDGLTGPTKLTDVVLKALQIEKPFELIKWMYGNLEWERVAKLAKHAFDLYETDNAAKIIIDKSVEFLFEYIKVIAGKMRSFHDDKDRKFTLVFSGSILTHENSIMEKLLRNKVENELSNIVGDITLPKVDPAVGAAFMCKSY